MTKFKEYFDKRLNEKEEDYLHTKDLKTGMMVMHKDWGRGSEPMKVVKRKGKLMLQSLDDEIIGTEDEFTELLAGGEDDYGWVEDK